MPFKANADRRHRIPKQRHRVTNWSAYEAGLRARGSLTVWFSDEAIEAESMQNRGGGYAAAGSAAPPLATRKPG